MVFRYGDADEEEEYYGMVSKWSECGLVGDMDMVVMCLFVLFSGVISRKVCADDFRALFTVNTVGMSR